MTIDPEWLDKRLGEIARETLRPLIREGGGEIADCSLHGELIDPRRLDLVIVPLFAFDARGTRLGTGGGYYDRTFSFAASSAAWRRPALIGVGYAFQQHERLERAPWDVPLDGAVTDRGTFRFRPGSRS